MDFYIRIYILFFIYFIHSSRFIVIFDCDLICILLMTNYLEAALVTQRVKNLPAMQDIQVRSLNWEDPLEKGVATHCSILAWRIQ